MAARFSEFTDSAFHVSGEPVYPYRIIGFMHRTDVYLKVELEHADDEPPERIAAEICRRVEKLYGVRSVEVSNFVTRGD
jgi:hypothetical protein